MNTRQIVLACNHKYFRRAPVGIVLPPNTVFPCLFDGYQPVKKIYDQEWRMRCFYVDLDGTVCRYGRWCGQSRASARRLARNHTNRLLSKDHPVSVAYDTITRDGRGRILRSDGRLSADVSVEMYGLTRRENGENKDLLVYSISDTVNTTSNADDPPPF